MANKKTVGKKKKSESRIIPAAQMTAEQRDTFQRALDKFYRKKGRRPNQRELVTLRAVITGMNGRAAAELAGYTGTPEALSVTASRVVANANVPEARQEALEAAFKTHNLTPDSVVKTIAEAMKAETVVIVGKGEDAFADVLPDHSVRLRANAQLIDLMKLKKSEDDGLGKGNVLVFNQQNNLNHYVTPKND